MLTWESLKRIPTLCGDLWACCSTKSLYKGRKMCNLMQFESHKGEIENVCFMVVLLD